MAHTAHGVERVTHWLDERGVEYELVTHAETVTAADEARAAGGPAGHVAKTLALHEHGSYKLVVIPASRRLDLVRLRELSGGSPHLRLASEHEMDVTSRTSRWVDSRELLRVAEPQVADICERIPGPHDTGFSELPQL